MLRSSRQPSSPQHTIRQSEVPVPSTNAPSRPAVDAERRQFVQSPEDVSRDAISYAASAEMVQSRLQVHREHAPSDEQTSYPCPTGPSAASSAPVITSALSLEHMQQLATSFLENVHPLYTFIRPAAIRRSIIARFSHSNAVHGNDTILFGIAVVGSLFGTNATTPSQDWHIELARNFEANIDADITRARSPQLELLASLVLKTIYNRLIARPYALWLTSCNTMNTINIMGKEIQGILDSGALLDLYFDPLQTLWIARLLNTWIAHDLGRPPIETPFDPFIVPPEPYELVSATPETHMVYLYHICEALRPDNGGDSAVFTTNIAKLATLDARQCHDGVLLSRTIMALCFHRLLNSNGIVELEKKTFSQLVQICLDGAQAAKRLAQQQKPWWHLANVPFQFICAMLIIDTASSVAQVPAALQTFEDLARAVPSSSMLAALELARKLIRFSRQQKTEQLRYLDRCCGVSQEEATPTQAGASSDADNYVDRTRVRELSLSQQVAEFEGFVRDESQGGGNYDSLDWNFLSDMDIALFDQFVS